MVTLNYIILSAFILSVSLWFYHAYITRQELPKSAFSPKRSHIAWVEAWSNAADGAGTLFLSMWIVAWLYHLWAGIEMPQATGVNVWMNVFIAISLIQRNASATVWRVAGYILLALSMVGVLGLLTGCQTSQKYEDPVQPAGAITITVPIPTCGDQMAKSLFMVSDRPKVLPINLLTEADKGNYDAVYKAYVETVQILTTYAVALERDRSAAQLQCKAIRQQVDTLNTKTPVIPVQK